MGKIIYEYDSNEEKWNIELINNAFNMYCALDEIYNIVRTELKHGQEELSDHIDGILEKILQESAFIQDFDQ
jgi:hypothetical protein